MRYLWHYILLQHHLQNETFKSLTTHKAWRSDGSNSYSFKMHRREDVRQTEHRQIVKKQEVDYVLSFQLRTYRETTQLFFQIKSQILSSQNMLCGTWRNHTSNTSVCENKKTNPPERNSFDSSWVPPPHPHNTTDITARITLVTGNDNILWMQQLIHCVFQMKWLHWLFMADWFWPALKCLPFLLRPISAKNIINNNKY